MMEAPFFVIIGRWGKFRHCTVPLNAVFDGITVGLPQALAFYIGFVFLFFTFHFISAFYQFILSVHFISAFYQCILSVHFISVFYQCILSVHFISADTHKKNHRNSYYTANAACSVLSQLEKCQPKRI